MEKAKSSIQEGIIPTVQYVTQLIDSGKCYLVRPNKPLPVPTGGSSIEIEDDDYYYYDATSIIDEFYNISSNNRTLGSLQDLLHPIARKMSISSPTNQNATDLNHHELDEGMHSSDNAYERTTDLSKTVVDHTANTEKPNIQPDLSGAQLALGEASTSSPNFNKSPDVNMRSSGKLRRQPQDI